MIRTIALKELRSLLHAPSTWFGLSALALIFSLSFLGRLDEFLQLQPQLALIANAPGATQAVVPYFFNIVAWIMMLLTPALTMRLLAEERRNQTLALLLSAPVSGAQIVLGKFAGLLLFLWAVILCCAGMTLTLALGTSMDVGLLVANTAGLLLLTSAYTALGLYVSALAAQPVLAAAGTLAVQFGLWFAESSATDTYRAWHALAPTGHFRNFNSGLLDSSDLVYFVVFSAFFLLLAIRKLANERLSR